MIGTDPNRSRVLNADGLALFLSHFVASVPADYEATDAKGVKYKPSALAPSDILYDRSKPEDQGYVTNALEGLWARAPYLHNGAVPTVYHVLVPGVAAADVRARGRHLRQAEHRLRLGAREARRVPRGLSDRGDLRHVLGRRVAARDTTRT